MNSFVDECLLVIMSHIVQTVVEFYVWEYPTFYLLKTTTTFSLVRSFSSVNFRHVLFITWIYEWMGYFNIYAFFILKLCYIFNPDIDKIKLIKLLIGKRVVGAALSANVFKV